ncbi:3469_t:CDS:2 [Funneliformis geosporum]|uniref:DNA-directed DNA polymerase n=1 Tax=Funneliformis geosporum TaxID=1117311 RepID=A0A9W4SY51_9GLOM|nr:3469_t:CDS:2 [Funneliformis geosporum]
MAIDNKGSSKKINEKYSFVLHLYSSLINGQKAVVTLFSIPVFFDILVSDKKSSDKCEIKVRDILSDSKVKIIKIEYIKAFPFRDYHTEKKTYLRIYTSDTGKRKTAMKAIQDNNYKTALDDLYLFYCKVARENGIQLSGWSMLTLLRDHTLVLTWNIETQSRKLDEFAKVLNLNQKRFIMKRAYHLNILEWMWERITGKFETRDEILKWKYREKIGAKSENIFKKRSTVKVSEEGKEDPEEKEYLGGPIKIKISIEDNFTSSFLKLPGYVLIDIRVHLKKRFPCSEVKKEGSLKFFLQKFSLNNTLRYQELLVNQSIINDYKDVASIAYVSLFDAYYRANEMKGIETKRPVTGLDFASLYSSLIMAYNLSPKKIIFDPKDADIAQNNENNLHKIEFSFNKLIVQT